MANKNDWNESDPEKWRKSKKLAKKWKRRVIYKETSAMHKFVKDSISALLDNTKKKDDDSLTESFSSMCKRLGYDKQFLKDRYNQLVLESRAMYTLSLMSVFVTTYSIGVLDYYVIMSSVVISFMFVLSGFVKSFRAWQIRSNKMGSFHDWCRQYEDWII